MYIHTFLYVRIYTCKHTHTCIYVFKTTISKRKRVNEEQVNEVVAGEDVGSVTGFFSGCFSDGRLYSTFDANIPSTQDDKKQNSQKLLK